MRRLILCSLLCLVLDGVHCNANQEVEVSAFGSVSTKERRKADAMTGIGSYIDQAEVKLGGMMRRRLESLLEDTFTDECRQEVTAKFEDIYSRLISEDWLEWEREGWTSECDNSRSPQATAPQKDPGSIKLTYLLLVHEQPYQIRRLVDVLDEPGYNFVIHVDGKESSQSTYEDLSQFAATRTNVYMMESGRQNISWGGFNIVQATLNGLQHALFTLQLDFDWIINLSGYTYPLVSNHEIREELARHPADTNFLELRPKPNAPQSRAWHAFVECDNRMRRIWRHLPPRNIDMYMGSQWMVITPEFATYLLSDRQFAAQYRAYGRYTMVADENFFVTVMKNSPFCNKHHNRNFLHVQFDQWEHQKEGRDPKKCLQPNPDHCGRSPTLNTIDFLPVLELGHNLFARKFDPDADSAILDAIDARRSIGRLTKPEPMFPRVQIKQMIDGGERCLQTSDGQGSRVSVRPCDPSNQHQLFKMGHCSTDGTIDLVAGGYAKVTRGNFTYSPYCPLMSHARLCLDLEKEQIRAGTPIIGYHCALRWNQLFGFGGDDKPGSIYINNPFSLGEIKQLCLTAQHNNVVVHACQASNHAQQWIVAAV